MRYSKDHKTATHARIVANASVRLREKGARGVGVADLMKEVGLTHGGFYSHFETRDSLLIEAFEHAMAHSTARWRRRLAGLDGEARRSALANLYLTSVHRDDPGKGCAISALAADMVRESPQTRKVFAERLQDLIAVFATGADGADNIERSNALATVSTLVGALILARAAGQGPLSTELLDAGRNAVLRLGTDGPAEAMSRSAKSGSRKPVAGQTTRKSAKTPAS